MAWPPALPQSPPWASGPSAPLTGLTMPGVATPLWSSQGARGSLVDDLPLTATRAAPCWGPLEKARTCPGWWHSGGGLLSCVSLTEEVMLAEEDKNAEEKSPLDGR